MLAHNITESMNHTYPTAWGQEVPRALPHHLHHYCLPSSSLVFIQMSAPPPPFPEQPWSSWALVRQHFIRINVALQRRVSVWGDTRVPGKRVPGSPLSHWIKVPEPTHSQYEGGQRMTEVFFKPRESKVCFIQSVLMFTGWVIIFNMEMIGALKRKWQPETERVSAAHRPELSRQHGWQLKENECPMAPAVARCNGRPLPFCFEWCNCQQDQVDLIHHAVIPNRLTITVHFAGLLSFGDR